jgi:hypothetical protein
MKLYKYLIPLLFATLVLGAVAMFVPPIWAMCLCTYNTVKSFLVFPGSLIGALIVLSLTHIAVHKGKGLRKAFFVNLLVVVFIFSLMGFSIPAIADFIDTHDLPLSRNEVIWDIPQNN